MSNSQYTRKIEKVIESIVELLQPADDAIDETEKEAARTFYTKSLKKYIGQDIAKYCKLVHCIQQVVIEETEKQDVLTEYGNIPMHKFLGLGTRPRNSFRTLEEFILYEKNLQKSTKS